MTTINNTTHALHFGIIVCLRRVFWRKLILKNNILLGEKRESFLIFIFMLSCTYYMSHICVSFTYTETERSSDWQLWCSLETLKLVFNVSSEYQGCQPDDIFVSVYVTSIALVTQKERLANFLQKLFRLSSGGDNSSQWILRQTSYPRQ